MKVYLIRHGETKGNREKRYAGSTDESLTKQGREALKNMDYHIKGRLYVSPLKRTRETAEILFPNREYDIVYNMRECNFGEFENMNYEELKDRREYKEFIATGGRSPFPGGEDIFSFQKRCCDEFENIVRSIDEDAVFVVHGGTIMAVLEKYGLPHREMYSYMAANGKGFKGDIIKGEKISIENIEEL